MVNGTKGIGPMEVEFEIASNLVSLNIDVMFACQDAKKIADSPEKNTEEAQIKSGPVESEENIVAEEEKQIVPRTDESIKNLGQFTIKGVAESQKIVDEGGKALSQN